MKTISKLFLVLFFAILCASCEKANEEQFVGAGEDKDFYYVRFEAESSYYYFDIISISLTGCEEVSTLVNAKSYSEILGPVSKGAIATIKASCSGECETAIYVSKNNGPFAFKKRGGRSLSYTIDF